MKPSELVLMASLQLSPSQAEAELRRLEPALINLAHLYPVRTATITATTLNVRDLPSTDSAIRGKLAAGDHVQVWGQTADGFWIVIEAGDLVGWVSQLWLIMDNPA